MKIITAIIQPFMLEKVVEALEGIEDFPGMTVTDVRGFGRRKVTDNESDPLEMFIEKTRIEIVALDERVETIIETIARSAHTGNLGDGKIFVWPVQQAVRVRNSELDDGAL
jgi:nitrogen regulatory protein P-II 1